MKEITLNIPDRIYNELKGENNIEDHIIEAISYYLNNPPLMELKRWQQHIEKKMNDLQMQLDTHRSQCRKDIAFDFDSDAISRISKKKDNLETDSFQDKQTSNLDLEKKSDDNFKLDEFHLSI